MSKLTTLEAPVYVAPWTLESIAERGSESIQVHAHGFWSDCITIYVRHEWNFQVGAGVSFKWAYQVSHSSGGRDSAEVADDLEAEGYFAQALLAAIEVAKQIRAQEPALEALRLARREADRAARAAEEAAEQARIDADPALGEAAAKRLVKQLWARAELDGEATAAFFVRGRDDVKHAVVVAKAPHSGVITARFNGTRCGRLDLPAKLAALSTREAPAE